jgi:membrane dipeptidase
MKKEATKNGTISRRRMLKMAGIAGAAAIGAPMLNFGRFRVFAGTEEVYSTRAIDLVKEATVMDMLSILTQAG